MERPTPETHSLILLRGLPGSGKSTLANVLAENNRYPVFSIDSYFTNELGEYHFVHTDNHLAYKNCEAQTQEALKNGITKVIVDNTFTIEWEMEPYFKLAEAYGYRLFVLTVENHHDGKNVHDVSEQQLEKMRQKFRVKL
jgi:predicted kinase